jgi:5'-nucleotidase
MARILVTNDDSIHSNGLITLAERLSEVGEVLVVAPATEMSGASHSITLGRPLRMRRHRENWHSVDGTPTDCVVMALYWLLKDQPWPDLVVSGINRGANLGDSVTYSGTVAGALEGSVNGLPSIALSLNSREKNDYAYAADFAVRLARKTLAEGLPKNTLLNVNIPVGPIRGFRMTRTGSKALCTKIVPGRDPRGREYFWIGEEGEGKDESPDVDYAAIERGLVSITPLRNDLTDRSALSALSAWESAEI